MRFGIVRPGSNGEDDEESNKKPKRSSAPQALGRESYGEVEEAVGYKFKDLEWLERAFTHRSASSHGDNRRDYERLEFLGDAVLDLGVAHLLLECHPDAKEGELSKMRAALVNTTALSSLAKRVKLGPFIRLGKGELSSGGSERPSILADVMEAVMGAIYRDGGFELALQCIEKVYGDDLKTVTPRDPKTELQEILHAIGSEPPTYLLECMEGPEHEPTFVSVVQVDGQIVGRGRGATKKASQQEAAALALKQLKQADEIDQMFLSAQNADESEEPAESSDTKQALVETSESE